MPMSGCCRLRWIADRAAAVALTALLTAAGCASAPDRGGDVRIAGSDTIKTDTDNFFIQFIFRHARYNVGMVVLNF